MIREGIALDDYITHDRSNIKNTAHCLSAKRLRADSIPVKLHVKGGDFCQPPPRKKRQGGNQITNPPLLSTAKITEELRNIASPNNWGA